MGTRSGDCYVPRIKHDGCWFRYHASNRTVQTATMNSRRPDWSQDEDVVKAAGAPTSDRESVRDPATAANTRSVCENGIDDRRGKTWPARPAEIRNMLPACICETGKTHGHPNDHSGSSRVRLSRPRRTTLANSSKNTSCCRDDQLMEHYLRVEQEEKPTDVGLSKDYI